MMKQRSSWKWVVPLVLGAVLVGGIGGFALSSAISTSTSSSAQSPASTAPPSSEPSPMPPSSGPISPLEFGDFPSADDTGVPSGTKLKKLDGQVILKKPGEVLENVEVNGCVFVAPEADNAIIRNVRVKSGDCRFLILNDGGAENLTVVDSELDGMDNFQGDSAVGGYNYTLTRVNIHGTLDGAKLGSNVTVEDSYIHDLAMSADSHNDGLQGLDGTNITIRHNTIIVEDGGTSAVLLGVKGNDEWDLNNVVIENNLLGGGAWTVYGGYQKGSDPADRVKGIKITNNKFTTQIFPKGGAYGPITSIDPPAVTTGGNVWYDGPNKGNRVY